MNDLKKAAQPEPEIVGKYTDVISDGGLSPRNAKPEPEPLKPDWGHIKALEESLREHMVEIQRLKALAQPEQEPVAYRFQSPATEEWLLGLEPPAGSRWEIEPLYAAPPQRKPLTDEEIDSAYQKIWRDRPDNTPTTFDWVEAGIRYAERAYGIGEHQ